MADKRRQRATKGKSEEVDESELCLSCVLQG